MKKIIVLRMTLFILFCGAVSSFGQPAVPEQENELRLVYGVMAFSTNISVVPHVRWVKISEKGDHQPDWEIEHHYVGRDRMSAEARDEGIFTIDIKDGSLCKSYWLWLVHKPMNLGIFPHDFPAVKVNGRFFEYRYPITMIWVAEYLRDGTPIHDSKEGGELSIKGEIISVNIPFRIKRTQQLKLPDGRILVTEFVYELQVKLKRD